MITIQAKPARVQRVEFTLHEKDGRWFVYGGTWIWENAQGYSTKAAASVARKEAEAKFARLRLAFGGGYGVRGSKQIPREELVTA
jgi:hypothetical protein